MDKKIDLSFFEIWTFAGVVGVWILISLLSKWTQTRKNKVQTRHIDEKKIVLKQITQPPEKFEDFRTKVQMRGQIEKLIQKDKTPRPSR